VRTTIIRILSALFPISAFGVFYSGLMFLEIVPLPPMRFWEGGPTALVIAAVLDLAGGLLGFAAGIPALIQIWKKAPDPVRLRRMLWLFVLASLIGVAGDLIGGLYAIAAQIGLYASLVVLYVTRPAGGLYREVG
jgi:hypothetical protein